MISRNIQMVWEIIKNGKKLGGIWEKLFSVHHYKILIIVLSFWRIVQKCNNYDERNGVHFSTNHGSDILGVGRAFTQPAKLRIPKWLLTRPLQFLTRNWPDKIYFKALLFWLIICKILYTSEKWKSANHRCLLSLKLKNGKSTAMFWPEIEPLRIDFWPIVPRNFKPKITHPDPTGGR